MRALKGKDGNWVTIAAAAGDPVPRADAPPETPQPEDVAAEAERLNGRLGGWAFKVSDYVYGELAKGLADYVQDEQPAAGATPAPGAQPQSQSRMETDDE